MYNIDQAKLNRVLSQLGGKVSKDDIDAALGALKNTNQNDLKKQLASVSKDELNTALSNNPALQKMISSNPELMKNLSSILGQK